MATRINKYLSESGYTSRRNADRLIEQNRVKINGVLATIGMQVDEKDRVTVDGKPISNNIRRIYLAFNKPVGITSTTDTNIKGNMIDYINYPERIFHIGRLDKDSEGLILLTNDGDIVNDILRAENKHDKEYIVTVDRTVTEQFCKQMSSGVPILHTITKPCVVKKIDDKTFSIILTQGLNRQIRRMCETFGYQVLTLKRIRIMHIKLDIPVGRYRMLTKQEENRLFDTLKGS